MVEANELLPVPLRMTLKTVVAQLPGVRIVYGVTGTATIGHQLRRRCFVACGAVEVRMGLH